MMPDVTVAHVRAPRDVVVRRGAYAISDPLADHLADQLVRRFTLRGTPFVHALEARAEGETVYLAVTLLVLPRDEREEATRDVQRDAEGRIELSVVSHFTIAEMRATKLTDGPDPLARFFRNAVLDALEHEVDECIFDDADRIFDPHALTVRGGGLRKDPFRDRSPACSPREWSDAMRERLAERGRALEDLPGRVVGMVQIPAPRAEPTDPWKSEQSDPVSDIARLRDQIEGKDKPCSSG